MSRLRRALAASLVAVAALAGVLALAPSVAAAAGPSTIDFDGRGWGHGRGMSQYGSFGYARDHGWTSARILDHYYGGTAAASIDDVADPPVNPTYVRVKVTAMDQQNVITIGIGAASTFSVSGAGATTIPPGDKSVRLVRSGTSWAVQSGPSCSGPFTHRGTGGNLVTVGRSTGTDQLRLCRPDGVEVWYPGSLRGFTDGTKTRTLNITTAEEYLRGVVPNEMPASWHPEALQVQAVAARSYLLAGDIRHKDKNGVLYADTCDTTTCQVYSGHFRRNPGGTRVATTDARTDAAIAATTGVVRRHANGAIARTEFSSTTGGWTAGGTFPAVEDLGDAISPRHEWSTTKSVTALENQCGGDFQRLVVTKRNGLGPGGGRVLTADLVCSNRTMQVTGNQVRSWLQLWSDWWFVDSDCLETPAATYVEAVHQLFLKRSASAADQSRWCPVVAAGNRRHLTNSLSVTDEWAGTRVDDLYQLILDRGADADGRANWVSFIAAGNRIEDVAARLYGSAEYFQRVGSTHRAYVESLYDKILHRSADASGRDNWVHQLDSGAMSRRQVAAGFYASIESRRDRVTRLYQEILGRNPDSGGLQHWADRLRTHGDIELAAQLAASTEYYQRVT